MSWLQPIFYLNAFPGPLRERNLWLLVAAFVLALLLAWPTLRYARRAPDKVGLHQWRRVASWCVWVGAVGLLLTALAAARVPYLSMRLWLVLWLLTALAWAGWLLYRWQRVVPAQRSRVALQREYRRYLPR
jgi:ABC-type amino acid transport system permease subunit